MNLSKQFVIKTNGITILNKTQLAGFIILLILNLFGYTFV